MHCRDKRPAGKILAVFIILFAGSVSIFSGCGYRVRGAVGTLPDQAQSLGIPTFRNSTTQYKIEQVISQAVLKEFAARTRATVNSSRSGVDLVLLGEILDVSSVPVTFDTQEGSSQTTGSTFRVSVRISVKLVRLSDASTIWKNDDFLFSERYVLNTNVRDFFSEDNPALERLAGHFAASLASSILTRSKP
jgi:hypothetical protein